MPFSSVTPGRPRRFHTTQWSMIVAAREDSGPASRAALESLCRAYWYPLYAYVRRAGHSPADAQDLTQAFFAQLLEKNWIDAADPQRGRFRTFLLVALRRFLAKAWRHASTQKRGGATPTVALDASEAEARFAVEPALGPDEVFEHRWAMTVLSKAMERLANEYTASHRAAEFEQLKDCLTAAHGEIPYDRLAAEMKSTAGAVRVAVHRLRKRFRDVLRLEVAETVEDSAELEDELRHLVTVLSRSGNK